jgi:hypothetical protein
MAYLSKKAILSAYSQLSRLTDDPSAQGATQVTSALRYLFALDEFTKKFEKDCDTSKREDRDAFIEFVGNVVSVNNDYYTANFFNSLKGNQDYSVGSNFFSVNVVKNSVVNPNTDFDFPKRGNNPLFVVKAGCLIEKSDFIPNLKEYLRTPELRNAFAVWLMRFQPLDKEDVFVSIINGLKNRYSDALINELSIDEQLVMQLVGDGLIDNPYSLSISDFPSNSSNKEAVVNLLPPKVLSEKVRDSFAHFVDLVNQHTEDFSKYIEEFENRLSPHIEQLGIGYTNVFQLVDFDQYKAIIERLQKEVPELAFLAKERENHGSKYMVWTTHRYYRNFLSILASADFRANIDEQKKRTVQVESSAVSQSLRDYLRAMRTKPFLLLAGISGTGKSRIVKQLAYKSCPDKAELRKDTTSPGNYCLIEVKPNWHDSTELLGYRSQIGTKHYVLTPFVKFLVKAMLHSDTPFFVCLDEMNLAPVEQYFAEFLSVLESRKKKDGHITSEALIEADVFKEFEGQLTAELFGHESSTTGDYDAHATSDPTPRYGKENEVYDTLKAEGLRIPENLIVIGTVNMDETTHQFSRKVIDRAMTIEMNIADGEAPFTSFFDDYEELAYVDNPLGKDLFLPKFVSADEALSALDEEDRQFLKDELPGKLAALNRALNGTPFKIAYRVQNELILYFAALRADSPDVEKEKLLATAIDSILMMKVLPRIEGDVDLLKEPLKALADYTANYPQSADKVKEMSERLERGQFTSFWP